MKWLFFIITPCFLHALTLDSGQVDYDGTTIILSDQVTVENEMGKFYAEWVKWDEKKQEMELKKEVECLFAQGMTLRCQQADFHLPQLELSFEGEVRLADAVFSMEAERLKLQISPDRRHIQELNVKEGIKCDYQDEMTLVADAGQYKRAADAPDEAPLYGLLLLTGDCGVSNKSGDRLLAEEMTVDFARHQLGMQAPRGLFSLGKDQLEVVAGKLLWDRAAEVIQLQDSVCAAYLGVGQFSTKEEMQLHYQVVEGERKLKQLLCLGETELNVKDKKQRFGCTLTCYGEILADGEKHVVVMKSPRNGEGVVSRQIFFQDGLAKMTADDVLLTFTEAVLDKVVLEGHVMLINRLTQFREGESPLQYALADTIEYLPQSKEISMAAVDQQRVLFLDRVNHIQISAPGLRIKRTTGAQKGYIQGLGDVRFSFAKKEMDKMNELFPNFGGHG